MRYTFSASAALASRLAATGVDAQSASPFSGARLVARADSFAVLVGGSPRGFAREAIERTAEGVRLTSRQALGTMMTQSTEVDFSPSLELKPGAEYRVVIFASGKGESRDVTLKIGEKDAVQVPAGTFDAYPDLMSGGPVAVTFCVSSGAAPRVVR